MYTLHSILAAHAATILQHAGFLPADAYRVQRISPTFTKYVLGPVGDGRWAMLHHFTGPDADPRPHDHPCRFESHILVGSYRERMYQRGQAVEVLRAAGSAHVIEPATIHRLLELPEGECWTLCLAGPVVRRWKHYQEARLLRGR